MPWKVAASASGSTGRLLRCAPMPWSAALGRNSTLCTWMCWPGAIALVALPMIWPSLRTGAPTAIACTASLWPRGIGSLGVTSPRPTSSPAFRSRVATTSGSAGFKRRTGGWLLRSVMAWRSSSEHRAIVSRVVHVDRLLLEMGVEAVFAVLASDAAVAQAGMVGVHCVAAGAVDVDLAEFQFPHQAHQAAHVLGEDIGGEAVAGFVGEAQTLVEIGHRHQRNDRAEDLVLHDGH